MIRAVAAPVALGFTQFWIELKLKLRRWSTLSFLIAPAVLFWVLRFHTEWLIGGLNTARWMLQSYPVTALSITGMVTLSSQIIAEQDEGNLLRAKTLPYGMAGYILGKASYQALLSAASVALLYAAAEIAIGGVLPTESWRLLLLLAVLVLTVASCSAIGVILGGLSGTPVAAIPISLGAYALVGISGIFLPDTILPTWATWIANVFPLRWLGDLSRHALGVSEPGAPTWWQALLVPGLWVATAALLLPRALGVMTRRQSGAWLAGVQDRKRARGF